jgi:hypothetical protein
MYNIVYENCYPDEALNVRIIDMHDILPIRIVLQFYCTDYS